MDQSVTFWKRVYSGVLLQNTLNGAGGCEEE